MKKAYYILYCAVVSGFLSASCEDKKSADEERFVLSHAGFEKLSYEGEELTVKVTSPDAWTATGQTDWCKLSVAEGNRGSTALRIEVEPNIEQERSCIIHFRTAKETQEVNISQQALPPGKELHYKLPIVIHVIYCDSTDKSQNPDGKYLQEVIADVNRIYKHAGQGSVDMNVEFVPAAYAPDGAPMKEPGINRVKWATSKLDVYDVMLGKHRKYNHFIWDPNKYINVLLYTFDTLRDPKAGQIMGVSTFPYCPSYAPLRGAKPVGNMLLRSENLKYAHCISINNAYVRGRSYLFRQYELDRKQTSVANTLAHELGHYLGLYHVFSESANSRCEDTDYCPDTPSYDRNLYTEDLKKIVYRWHSSPIYRTDELFYSAFKRRSCDGTEYDARNIMDYTYCYQDLFTADQRARVRHVLSYSPLIPGPKKGRNGSRTRSVEGLVDLPVQVMCLPRKKHEYSDGE